MLLTFSLLCAAGLLDYCNFGPWTFEEDQQLKKNWKKIVEVCVFVILILLQKFFSDSWSFLCSCSVCYCQ